MKSAHKVKISKGAHGVKIKWDEKKHQRDIGGRFKFKPGTEEFKAEPFGAGKTSGVVDADVIKLHVKANPKKPGSAASNDFAKYQDNMTVGEFKAAVGPAAKSHLAHDTGKGFITIHDPKTLPPVEKELAFSDYVITSKTSGVQTSDKIKLLSVSNPKKPGSKSAEDFAKYKDEMTVGEFHAAVGDKGAAQSHVLHDLKKGYISVHNPAELKLLKTGAKSPGQAAAEMKIGDKKLGTLTNNPFAAGSKNHDDFEATAAKLGLQTSGALGAANKAAGDAKVAASAAPGAKQPTATAATSTLKDDDIIISSLGNAKTVKEWEDSSGWTKEQLSGKIANNNWTLKPAASTGTLKDDDVIETYMGNKYTVCEYKAKMGVGTAYVDSMVKNGQLTLATKATAVTTTIAKPGAAINVADIPMLQQGQYDLQLTTTTNPYPHASDEWIKFQSIAITYNKQMTVSKYYTTKALTPAQKTVTLQKMIDDGHVKLVTPDQKAAVQAQKDKIAATAATAATAAAQSKHKMHWEQVKPADFHNDPKWSKVPGFKDLDNMGDKFATANATKNAIGLKYNSKYDHSAVRFYTGSGYRPMNFTLREHGFQSLDAEQQKHTLRLDKLTLADTTKADAIMWRGIGKTGTDPKNFNNMPPPSEFTDMGFSSMSHRPSVSTTFSGKSVVKGYDMRTLFRVRVPKGTRAAFIGREHTEAEAMKDEAEVITARGTRFKYISTTRDVNFEGTKYDVIELEIVNEKGGAIT